MLCLPCSSPGPRLQPRPASLCGLSLRVSRRLLAISLRAFAISGSHFLRHGEHDAMSSAQRRQDYAYALLLFSGLPLPPRAASPFFIAFTKF